MTKDICQQCGTVIDAGDPSGLCAQCGAAREGAAVEPAVPPREADADDESPDEPDFRR